MDARRALGTALFLGLALVACDNEEHEAIRGATANLAGGFTQTTPSIEGAWTYESVAAAPGCGALNSLFPTGGVLTLAQAGNGLEFALADECGRPLPGGDGTVATGGALELTSDETLLLTSTCTLLLHQVRTGSTGTPPETFSGTDVLTITGSGVCDPSLPCTVSGTFVATSCPRTGCVVSCPTP